MTRKKLLLPILTILPFLFMANSPAPVPSTFAYDDVQITWTDISEGEEAPHRYQADVSNSGQSKCSIFQGYPREGYAWDLAISYKDGAKTNPIAREINYSLFANEVIMPSESKSYVIDLVESFETIPEVNEFYVMGFREEAVFGHPDTFEVKLLDSETHTYYLDNISRDYYSGDSIIVLEVTYDEAHYAFFSELSDNEHFKFTANQELDLSKFEITKATAYKRIYHHGGGGGLIAGVFIFFLMMIGGGIGLAVLAVIVFVIAPAIAIPILVTTGRHRAINRERKAAEAKMMAKEAKQKEKELSDQKNE